MNYELAKKLKDAGFPFDFGGVVNDDTAFPEYPDGKRDFQFTPSLEELIEACGEGFKNLSHGGAYYLPKPDVMWYANYKEFDGTERWRADGSTPAEAVAKLWLSLHAQS